VELIVGRITNSVSLTADAIHMLSDALALLIGLGAAVIAKRPTTENTYGWVRAEVLGPLVNSVFLCSLCLTILFKAIERLIELNPLKEIDLLLYTGSLGLMINLLGLFVFGHGHSHGVSHELDQDTSKLGDENDEDLFKINETAERCEEDIVLEVRTIENDALITNRVKLEENTDDVLSISVVNNKKKNKKRCCVILCK